MKYLLFIADKSLKISMKSFDQFQEQKSHKNLKSFYLIGRDHTYHADNLLQKNSFDDEYHRFCLLLTLFVLRTIARMRRSGAVVKLRS